MILPNFKRDLSLGYPVIFGECPIGMSQAEHALREAFVGIILSEFRLRESGMSERTGALLSDYLSGKIDTEELTEVCMARAAVVSFH